MKTSNVVKTLAVALLVGLSPMSYASTVYDTVTTSFNLDLGFNNRVDYVGTVDTGGVDTWTVNLTGPAGLVVDITTGQDVGYAADTATAVSLLRNITYVGLYDGATLLGGASAVYSYDLLTHTLSSTANFAIATLVPTGTYTLKILGDATTAYSGTISAVPLPGAALLFGSVLLGAGALRRKQAKAGEMAAA